MEPETSIPKIGPETAPVQYGQNVEFLPRPATPEAGIEAGVEHRKLASEAAASAADASGALPTMLPTPVSDDSLTTVDPASQGDSTTLTANDDDLIEKEWVDRAKKIIIDTKEDPYKREEAVSQLQKEYQEKRYGRELGEA